MKRLFILICLLTFGFSSQVAFAEASPDVWPVLQKSFFGDKIIELSDALKLEGPHRAESGAQVPITLIVNNPEAFKNVYLFVDANPIPLAAIYHFTALNGKAQLSTRIRMQTDSFIHAVGETADGKLYLAVIAIRAAGGCGGTVDGDDAAIRAAAGQIKLNVEAPVKFGEANPVVFLIKHPMFTGLQRDLVSGGYKPAFFINKVSFDYNGKPVMQADFGVAISEDPYLRFFYLPDGPGKLDVTALDNEGKTFTHEVDVSN